MDFTHLKTRTTFSLRKATSKPDELVKLAKKQGATSLALTELGNLFSVVKFVKACKKNEVKPIIGCDFYIQGENLSNLTILSKNKQGWNDLLKAIAVSNGPDNFNLDKEVATIPFQKLADCNTGQWIAYLGNLFSYLIPCLISDYKGFIQAEDYGIAKGLVKTDWKEILKGKLGQLQDVRLS